MNDQTKTRQQLAQELEEMRQKLETINACWRDFELAKEKFERLLEAAPDALVFVNSDYKIVLVNAQTEQLFGYTQEEVIGRDLDILIPERFHHGHRMHVAEYFEIPRLRTMGSYIKIYARKKDGSEFRADISLSPMRIEGELLVAAAVRDITKRVQEQEQIERNYHIQRVINSLLKTSLEPVPLERQLDNALDLILSVPYLALRSKGAIYLVEGESRELVLKTERGMSEQERAACERVPLGKCLCGQAAARCEVVFTDCVDLGHETRSYDMSSHGHYCVPIVSGGKPLGVINVYVQEWHRRDPNEEAFLTAVADTIAGVVERQRAETEKRVLQDQLFQSEKLAALGRIVSNVAHEIRNPLTSIGGFARRLLKKVPQGSAERGYVDLIVSETADLERILKNVLAYSRNSIPRTEEQDMHKVINAVLKSQQEALSAHSITISRSFGAIHEALIDSEQVKEAFKNLILNAIDAMPSGGTLTVATSCEEVRNEFYVVVRISDTGEGIPEETRHKLFEPFFTTRIAKRGIGLGLPISKKIMEDHGGFITVESEVGKGSTFSLHFPCGQC